MRLSFRISRWEVLILAGCHILVAYPLWYAGWPVALSLPATAVIAGHAWYQLFLSLKLIDRSLFSLELLSQGKALLITRGGILQGSLCGAPFYSSVFMLLDFKLVDHGKKIGPGSTHPYVRQLTRQANHLAQLLDWFTGRRLSGTNYRILVAVDSLPLQQRKQLACYLKYRDRDTNSVSGRPVDLETG